MKNRKIITLLLCAALVANMLITGCSRQQSSSPADAKPSEKPSESNGAVSAELPTVQGGLQSFSATALDGSSFTQDDIAAKDITMINFWSLTCRPCIAEMPDLAAFAKALPDNVQLITVCLDGILDEEITKIILDEAGYEGITLIAGDGDFQTVCANIQYTPTTILVDAEGNLVGNAIIGGQEDLSSAFLTAINAALKASGKAETHLET